MDTKSPGLIWICTLLKEKGFAKSNGDARRLVQMGAVRFDGIPMKDPDAVLTTISLRGKTMQVGVRQSFTFE